MEPSKTNPRPDYFKLALILFSASVILAGTIYVSYRYSQQQRGEIVLPGGTTYLGPTTTR